MKVFKSDFYSSNFQKQKHILNVDPEKLAEMAKHNARNVRKCNKPTLQCFKNCFSTIIHVYSYIREGIERLQNYALI